MKRTLIEFYDRDHLDNTFSLFGAHYDKVVYLYPANALRPTEPDKRILARFIRARFGLTPEYAEVENSIPAMLDHFRAITADGSHCDFDITGGSALYIASVGLFAASAGNTVSFHQYNIAAGKLLFRQPGAALPLSAAPEISLSVPEVIALGGSVLIPNGSPIRYDLAHDDLRGEILRLWDTVKDSLKSWNNFCVFPSAEGHTNLTGKQVSVHKRPAYDAIASRLNHAGILSNQQERPIQNGSSITFRLNVPESARFLYDKGGTLLEMFSYLAAMESGCFSDCCTGVALDWNGRTGDDPTNPYNEIDLLLTCGHIPVFVSCKSTDVENDYLYEIMTMTRHFGGRYARPMLISSVRNRQSIRDRAKEMGIILLDDVASLSLSQLVGRLRSVARHYF